MMRKLVILFFLMALPGLSLARSKHLLKVDEVEFSGNDTFDKDVLYKVIISRPSKLFAPVVYNEEIFKKDLVTLGRYYQRRGFLKTEIPEDQIEIDSLKGKVNIRIQINEGPRTTLDAINFIGNSGIADTTLSAASELTANEPLDADAIEQANRQLLRLYADQGYLEAVVEPVWSLDPEALRAILDFNIREGVQFSVGQIAIEGIDKTLPRVVERELTFQTGEIVNYSEILKSQRKLYLTGLFESVYIDPQLSSDPSQTRFQDMHIKLKENQAGAFNVSIGYGSEERVRVKSEFTQNNLRGTANKVGLLGRISALQRLLELSHSNPRIMNSLWRMDMNLKYELQFQPSYRLQTYGWLVAAQRNIDNTLTATLTMRNEINKLSHVKVDTLAGTTAANVHSLKLRISKDTRDNLFNPKKGSLLEWENEIAGGPVTSSNSFYRSTIKYRWFRSLFTRSILGTALEIGVVTTPKGTLSVSLQERFYTGGPNSLRGYAYREVGPRDKNNYPLGGFYKLVWNVFELRVPVYKGLMVATFTDLGNVWWEYKDILTGQWAIDVGAGLYYNTPIGVIRLDVGVPVGNIPAQDAIRFNFSMGYAF